MPSRSTPETMPEAEQGFSLVELLVVVFIVSVVAGLILLTAPPGRLPVEREADRLAGLAAAARERALVSGQAHGIAVEPDGWTLVRHDGQRWSPVAGTAHRVAGGITIEPSIAQGSAPALIFEPLGAARAGMVTLRGDGALNVSVTMAGDIVLGGDDEV